LAIHLLDPEDVRSLSVGAIWDLNRAAMIWASDYGEHRACVKVLGESAPKGHEPFYYSILFYSILFYSILFYSIL